MTLDCWAGIGHVAVGMHRQGFDLQLTEKLERLLAIAQRLEGAKVLGEPESTAR